MAGLDSLAHSRNLTTETYCDYADGGFPCVGSIAEPTTMVTDYLLTVELFVIAGVLLRSGWSATPTWARNWAVGFAFLGVSFAFGGSEHGFALPLKCEGREACIESSWVWIVTLLTQTPGLALPVVGATQLVLGNSSRLNLVAKVYAALIVAIFSVLAIVGAAATPLDGFLVGFLIVIIFSVPSVLIVLVLLSLPVCCCRTDKPQSAQVFTLIGWIVCIVSLVWQATGIGVAAHFNHNDIFHTIFIIGLAITAAGLNPQLKPPEATKTGLSFHSQA